MSQKERLESGMQEFEPDTFKRQFAKFNSYLNDFGILHYGIGLLRAREAQINDVEQDAKSSLTWKARLKDKTSLQFCMKKDESGVVLLKVTATDPDYLPVGGNPPVTFEIPGVIGLAIGNRGGWEVVTEEQELFVINEEAVSEFAADISAMQLLVAF